MMFDRHRRRATQEAKGGSGVAERIIRQMPPHSHYVEAFAGHAAVFRKKAPAAWSFLIDADPNVCDWLKAYTAGSNGVTSSVLISCS